jgi:hypothetical protein
VSKRLLVISAHSADFVWRAAGAIATVVENGGTAHVVALSYGERGESGELWKEEGQTKRGEGDPSREATAASRSGRLVPRPRRLPARRRPRCRRSSDRRDPCARAAARAHTRGTGPVQPRPRCRVRGDRAGAPARKRCRRRELLRDDRAARAAALRAASARAVRLRADDVSRHHGRLGAEGGRHGGDGSAAVPPAVLLRARGAPGESRPPHLRPQRRPLRRGVPARDPHRRRCAGGLRDAADSASPPCTRLPAAPASSTSR